MGERHALSQAVEAGAAVLAGLILPVACVCCGRTGRVLCVRCRGRIEYRPPPPRTLADGLRVYSAAVYESLVRDCVLASKRTGSPPLARLLAELAAAALVDVVGPARGDARAGRSPGAVVVPVHSGAATTRSAGLDLSLELAKRATAIARVRGCPARACDLLSATGRHGSQKALGSHERAGNVAGSMASRSPGSRRFAAGRVILFDDVVTTGATLIEARRALVDGGVAVDFAVTIASTVRRVPS